MPRCGVGRRKTLRYTRAMLRRWSALSLLVLNSFLLLLAPLAAAATGPDPGSRMPACCRRDGKHKCSMAAGATAENGVTRVAPERCPCCTKGTGQQSASPSFAAVPPDFHALRGLLYSHPAGAPQTLARQRVSELNSWSRRGPPVSSLVS